MEWWNCSLSKKEFHIALTTYYSKINRIMHDTIPSSYVDHILLLQDIPKIMICEQQCKKRQNLKWNSQVLNKEWIGRSKITTCTAIAQSRALIAFPHATCFATKGMSYYDTTKHSNKMHQCMVCLGKALCISPPQVADDAYHMVRIYIHIVTLSHVCTLKGEPQPHILGKSRSHLQYFC